MSERLSFFSPHAEGHSHARVECNVFLRLDNVDTKEFVDACVLLVAPAQSKSYHTSHRMIISEATGTAVIKSEVMCMCVCAGHAFGH